MNKNTKCPIDAIDAIDALLIAIAIAEEIQELQRIVLKICSSEFSLTLAKSLIRTGFSWGESRWCSRSGLRTWLF